MTPKRTPLHMWDTQHNTTVFEMIFAGVVKEPESRDGIGAAHRLAYSPIFHTAFKTSVLTSHPTSTSHYLL